MKHFQLTIASLFILIIFIPSAISAQSAEAIGEAFIWNADDPDLAWGPCPEFLPDDCRIAVLQGNPEEPNADVLFKLQGNTKAPNHIHTSAERMILISGEFHVDYENQDPVVMTAGTYAYGPAGLPHTASCVSDEPCILFIAFEQPVDAIPVD
jgi:quercetin dioxygenase-like cupin family protein